MDYMKQKKLESNGVFNSVEFLSYVNKTGFTVPSKWLISKETAKPDNLRKQSRKVATNEK